MLDITAAALAWFEYYLAIAYQVYTEQHPPKRRRTLAGSILDTAVSAALVGTAVGLTVYRLWRERGHPPPSHLHNAPPPPYHEVAHSSSSPIPATKVTPATPRRKSRRTGATVGSGSRHRKAPSNRVSFTSSASSATVFQAPLPPPEFDFSSARAPSNIPTPSPMTANPSWNPAEDDDDEPMEAEDTEEQYSLLNNRLSQLIADGQRALGSAVVVAAESVEDAVDDGLGGWSDEEDAPAIPRTPGGSVRKRRPRSLIRTIVSPRGTPTVQSPQKDAWASALATPEALRSRSNSVHSVRSVKPEDENEWQSPEMRELMQRARASRGL
jgi:hypothetical protein